MIKNYDFVFLIEKLLGLFWVLVQQSCFCVVKYVYEGLIPNGRSLRYIVSLQLVFFAFLVLLCFEEELGLKFLSLMLKTGRRNFYPWAVRVALCSAMILFDALLLLYGFRIYRLYKYGITALSSTLIIDFILTLSVFAVCVIYTACMIHAALARNISMNIYMWMGRAFIQFSNFFYVPLEITGAVLLYKFYKAVHENKNDR